MLVETVYSTEEWVLGNSQEEHFKGVKERAIQKGIPMVLWGWKRDMVVAGTRMPESRTVYFSADLGLENSQITISRHYFFLETRASESEIQTLRNDAPCSTVRKDPLYHGYSRLRIEMGKPTEYDQKTVERRLRGKPRLTIPPPKLVLPSENYDLSNFAPFALCAGSGLSSESGLPLLGTVHELFGVDNPQSGQLVFGSNDTLPKKISQNPQKMFRQFCKFNIDAILAVPSTSHIILANMQRNGIIGQIFTDNMDDIFAKVKAEYVVTRQGIFPDKYPVKFNENTKSLLVVGVAVDRRKIIEQARQQGLKIISINPVLGVAPHSRNMDYLNEGDILFRDTAGQALPKIISESGF